MLENEELEQNLPISSPSFSAKSSISGECDWNEDEEFEKKSISPVKNFHKKISLDMKNFNVGIEAMDQVRQNLQNIGKMKQFSKTHHTRNYSNRDDFAEGSFS